MKKFCVFIEGVNFDLIVNSKKQKHGFYAARFVQANDEKQARKMALDSVVGELENTFKKDEDFSKKLSVEELSEVKSFGDNLVPGAGFAWYPMKKK